MGNIIEKIKKDYVIWLCAIALLMFIIIFAVNKNNRGTFSLEEDGYPSVKLECDDASLVSGGDVSCDVILDAKETTILSLNANYSVSTELKFKSFSLNEECNAEDCFISFHDSELGFALGNVNGVVGEHVLATVVFTLPADILPNTEYKIGLTNIEFSDVDYKMYELEDVVTVVSTLSDVASLDDILIEGATLNEVFNKNVTEYTAKLNEGVSVIEITTTKTDDNSVVSGNVGNVDVNYGTNELKIIVTSQDGNNQKIYNIEIFRDYTFSSIYDKYKYYEDENKLYVSNDLDTDIITNLALSEVGLSGKISSNKLVISREKEELASVNLIGFKCNDCLFIDNNLYIDYDNYEDLINTFTLNGVTVKVRDDAGELVTSGEIDENYKVEISYGDDVLESFVIVFEKLSFDESLTIDEDNMLIKRVAINTTYESIISKINNTKTIIVTDKDGNIVSKTEKVKTGDVITIELINGEVLEYTISVLGDTTGDGIIDVNDVGRLYRHVKNVSIMTGAYLVAGEVVVDGEYTVNDVGKLYRYMKKVDSTLEVVPQ